MVAISFYRGNLHRVPDRPRQWPMPKHCISLRDFKLLIRKRTKALSLLRSIPNSTATPLLQQEETAGEDDDSSSKPQQHQHLQSNIHPFQSQPNTAAPDIANNCNNPTEPSHLAKSSEAADPSAIPSAPLDAGSSPPNPPLPDCGNGSGSKDVVEEPGEAKMEVKNMLDIPTDKVKRKKELEKKLQILNEKKHHLVQALKQILNAEEEMMRRNSIQVTVGRAAVPLQAEAQAGTKMGSEAIGGSDLEGESEDASNHNAHARPLLQMQCTSPSMASPLRRPVHGSLQHNMAPYPIRASLVASGHAQTTSAGVTASPSRFAPLGYQGHAASLPPLSVSGSHFIASSPSPAASGGTPVLRDGRLTSPQWN